MSNDERRTDATPAGENGAAREFPVVLLRDGRVVEPVVHEPLPRRGMPTWAWASMLTVTTLGLVVGLVVIDLSRPPAVGAASTARMPILVVAAPSPSMVERPAEPMSREDDGSIDACGLGRLKAEQRDDPEAWEKLMRKPIGETMDRTIATLAAQGDERSRAVGALLKGIRADGAARADCKGEACDDTEATRQAWRSTRDTLARMASATTDPTVYAMAIQACPARPRSEDGPCQLVSMQRWAQLDPDNAAVWLQVADEAQKRSDAAAFDEAMFRASKAKRSDLRFGQVPQTAVSAVPKGTPASVTWSVTVGLIGWEAARALPGYQHVGKYCSASAVVEPNRRQVCDDLANVLIDRSDTMLDRAIGVGIARRLGWPAERLAAIDEERDAISGFVSLKVRDVDQGGVPAQCEFIEADLQQVRDMAEHGELGAFRSQMERSGIDRATLAARHRQSVAAARSAAASAPAPASAASATL